LEGQHSEARAGNAEGQKPGKWDKWLIPRFAKTPPGSRLTEERKKTIQIGEELKPKERELLLVCLENREMALAWDRSEMETHPERGHTSYENRHSGA
jgi:hypothetical protein